MKSKTKLVEARFSIIEGEQYVSIEGKVYIFVDDVQKMLDKCKPKERKG